MNKLDEKFDHKDAWITLTILSSLALIAMYGETMLIPAIPILVNNFKIPYNTSSWILTAYLIAGAVMTPIVGKLSDIHGKKKILIIVMFIYSIGTFFGGISQNIYMMIFSRIIQGIGLSMFPVAFVIIREKFPAEKLAIGQGIFTAVFAGGAIVGLGLGSTIIEYFSWHMTFLSIVPLLIILLIVVIKLIHIKSEKLIKNPENVIDIKGTITLIILVTSFLVALTLLPNYVSKHKDINLLIITISFILTIVLLPVFIIFQKNTEMPLINLQLLKDAILLPTNILIMTIGMSIFIIYQSIPIMIQSPSPLGFGDGPVGAARIQLPFMITSFIISILSGFFISKIGNIKPTIIGCIINVIGFFLLYINHSTELTITIELAIIAVGLSFAEIGAFNISLVYTPIHLSGTALGITMLLFLIGMSLGPTISGIYMESFKLISTGTVESFPSDFAYEMIFLTATIISLFSVLLTIIITKKINPTTSARSIS
ncbi:MAG TPA: MFS transporter [Candidatus Nitrosocosmicus sp.]